MESATYQAPFDITLAPSSKPASALMQALGNISTISATAAQVQLTTTDSTPAASPVLAPASSASDSIAAETAAQGGPAPSPSLASSSPWGASYQQGVLLATSGLRLPNGDVPVSQLAGAFTSNPTSAQLVFILQDEVAGRDPLQEAHCLLLCKLVILSDVSIMIAQGLRGQVQVVLLHGNSKGIPSFAATLCAMHKRTMLTRSPENRRPV